MPAEKLLVFPFNVEYGKSVKVKGYRIIDSPLRVLYSKSKLEWINKSG